MTTIHQPIVFLKIKTCKQNNYKNKKDNEANIPANQIWKNKIEKKNDLSLLKWACQICNQGHEIEINQ